MQPYLCCGRTCQSRSCTLRASRATHQGAPAQRLNRPARARTAATDPGRSQGVGACAPGLGVRRSRVCFLALRRVRGWLSGDMRQQGASRPPTPCPCVRSCNMLGVPALDSFLSIQGARTSLPCQGCCPRLQLCAPDAVWCADDPRATEYSDRAKQATPPAPGHIACDVLAAEVSRRLFAVPEVQACRAQAA